MFTFLLMMLKQPWVWTLEGWRLSPALVHIRGTTTLGLLTLRIRINKNATLSMTILGATTLSIMTLSITAFSLKLNNTLHSALEHSA